MRLKIHIVLDVCQVEVNWTLTILVPSDESYAGVYIHLLAHRLVQREIRQQNRTTIPI
jgi:hypothetical protein